MNRRYATLDQVKRRLSADFLTDAGLTDADVLERIEASTAMIEEWTGQIFQSSPEVVRASARGDKLIYHPNMLPILLLKQIVQDTDRTTGEFKGVNRIMPGMNDYPERLSRTRGSLPGSYGGINASKTDSLVYNDGQIAYEPGKRLIEMITLSSGFQKGFHNIEISAWWAWLDTPKLVNATLSAALDFKTPQTALQVDDVIDDTTGFFIEVGDTVAIEVAPTIQTVLIPTRVELAIVTAVAGTGPYDLTVDTMHPYPFIAPIGGRVWCFGRTPPALSDVCGYLAAKLLQELAAQKENDAAGQAFVDGSLVSERTDNYSYTLANSQGGIGGGGAGGLGKFTGSARMDLVLRKFVAPAVAMRYI